MEQTDAISRSELIYWFGYYASQSTGAAEYAYQAAKRKVMIAPALDVAPVVRCYECKYRCTQTCPMYHTEICLDDLDGFDSYDTDRTDDDGFCHLGARMDGEADAAD